MPRFSVIIPVYNKGKQLSKTIESVLEQCFSDFEIIIINDGSTDASESIIKSFKDSRIHYIKQKNQGVSVARNTGIKAANADYIALLDADDLWKEDYLEKIDALIDGYPKQHVFATVCIIESRGKMYKPTYSVSNLSPDKSYILPYFASSYINTILTSSSTVVHKEVFNKIGYYDPALVKGEDTDFWIRLGLHYLVVFLNTPLATYRFEATSLSNASKQVTSTIDLKEYEKYTKNHPGLKKFLDLNRYSLAIAAKTIGNKKEFNGYKNAIDLNSLNTKQRILLKAPALIINELLKFKTVLENLGIQLSTYK
jgi:glycosyltransferase involved in cell wall biosynthesis